MRALVIAPQPFFSPRGTPFSVYYRALVATQLGVRVDLLTYGEGTDVDIPGVRIVRIPHFRMLGSVKVGPSLLKLFLDLFMVLWTLGMLLRRRYHFVHAHEEAVIWCRFLKPIFRFKLVYDMHSSLPQQMTNFQYTKSRMIIGIFNWLERTCLRSADAVITICPDLRSYALRAGVDPSRHFMIENSLFDSVRVSADAGSDIEMPPALNGENTGGATIVYAGTFEPYQGVELLVQAFAQVVELKPDTRLLLAGGTTRQVEQVRDLVESLGLQRQCILTGQVPKSQAVQYANAADVLVSPRRLGTNTPLKLYEQIASGKPLVATRIWSHTQVLDDDSCFLVDPEPHSIAQGILAAIDDHDRRKHVVERAQKLYQRRYSREAYEQKMRQLLGVLH